MLDVEWGMRHGNVLPQIADLFAGGEPYVWSVERVPLDVEWVYNGEHGAKRLCLYDAKSDTRIKK